MHDRIFQTRKVTLMSDRTCEVTVTIKSETPKAYLVATWGKDQWLPKSQMDPPGPFELGQTVEVIVPEWLAYDKGLL